MRLLRISSLVLALTGFVFACGAATAPATSDSTTADEAQSPPPREQDPSPRERNDERHATPAQSSSLSAFESGILAAHNTARANVQPAASPALPPLQWDERLASLARDWVSRCPDGHRPDNEFGENIYWSGGMEVTPEAPLRSWMSEAQYYDYRSTVCAREGRRNWSFCGHYSQVVWRETTRVGCAVKSDCPGQMENVVVCNYDPPGNVNVSNTSIPHPY